MHSEIQTLQTHFCHNDCESVVCSGSSLIISVSVLLIIILLVIVTLWRRRQSHSKTPAPLLTATRLVSLKHIVHSSTIIKLTHYHS